MTKNKDSKKFKRERRKQEEEYYIKHKEACDEMVNELLQIMCDALDKEILKAWEEYNAS